MATLRAQERYYTSLKNSMDVLTADLKDDLGLQVRRLAGGQHTQSEFLYLALTQVLEEIQELKAMIGARK